MKVHTVVCGGSVWRVVGCVLLPGLQDRPPLQELPVLLLFGLMLVLVLV